MQQTPRRSVTVVTVAVLGVGFVAASPVVAPDVEQRAVELAAAGDIVDLTSLGDLSGELPDLSALSLAADSVAGDPLGDLWQQIYDAMMPIIGPIILFTPLIVGALLLNVAQFFADAYGWIAGLFGFDPYPVAAEAFGTGLADIGAAGGIDPGLSTELSTAVGDITALFSGAAGPLASTDLAADLSTVLDPSAIADFGAAVDPAELADIGTLLSSLIP